MNNIKLILPEKGRPLFNAKNLLERISFHQKYDGSNEAESISSEEIFATEIALKSFMKILIDIDKIGLKRSQDEYNIIREFPLFLTSDFVHLWENEKPWKKYNIDTDVLYEYEKIVNGKKPSMAYDSNLYYTNIVLKEFFLTADLKTILEIINNSIFCLNNYIQQRPEKHSSILSTNILTIKENLFLTEEETKVLYYITVLLNTEYTHINTVWERLLKRFNYNTSKFFATIENSIGLPSGYLLSFFNNDSTLVKYKFFNELSSKNCNNDIFINNNSSYSWNLIWNSIINPILKNNIRKNYQFENKKINDYFITEIKDVEAKNLSLDNWDYLLPLINIWKVQLKEQHTKILFFGKSGCGKTSLSHSLLKNLGFNIYTPISNDLASFNISKNIVNSLPNSSLVLDEISYLKDNKFSLEKCNSNVICIVKSLEGIPENILNSFDYIYDLSLIPFEKRLAYAKIKFKDENLAIKASQQLKTFSSLDKASQRVTNIEDWKIIYPHISIDNNPKSDNYSIIDFNEFKDIPNIAGYEDIYKDFDNILDLLNNPYKYSKLSAKIPKGFLIEGNPGTGKTLFVKHIAKKAEIPLIFVNSSQISSKLDELKELFDTARNIAPCILFFDEIDTLLVEAVSPIYIDTKKQQILNAMLTELDGIKSLTGVIVIGATNYADKISPRALRSGRISGRITINEPNSTDRKLIWESYLANKPTEEINTTLLSNMTSGFSGADICETVNQAALIAAYQNSEKITFKHIDEACENVLWGTPNKQIKVTEESLWKTSVHETGHALLALKFNRIVNRVTIVPRQSALGITNIIQQEGVYSFTQEDLNNTISIFLAGIVAEKVVFGAFESGGSSDLHFIKRQIDSAFRSLGFNPSIGYINAGPVEYFSEKQKSQLEHDAKELTDKIFLETLTWLEENKDLLVKCAKELLKHKSISRDITEKWKEEINDIKKSS